MHQISAVGAKVFRGRDVVESECVFSLAIQETGAALDRFGRGRAARGLWLKPGGAAGAAKGDGRCTLSHSCCNSLSGPSRQVGDPPWLPGAVSQPLGGSVSTVSTRERAKEKMSTRSQLNTTHLLEPPTANSSSTVGHVLGQWVRMAAGATRSAVEVTYLELVAGQPACGTSSDAWCCTFLQVPRLLDSFLG